MTRRSFFIWFFLLLGTTAMCIVLFGRPLWQPVVVKLTGGRTVDQAIAQYGPDVEIARQIESTRKVIFSIGLRTMRRAEARPTR